ncbi:hypothetical protein Hrd1104_02855 [Halorhabdus sp. CBA1104]|jgi:hypothetical protein|uniref:hypothetical protein n=1 Tax=unclassified Halorhabdus TaxID=2621901 RepID=UPI0012B1DF47|nr:MULTISPECIES: hypothetical protein [unclassified Halorhabdus]QGN06336.1 hypothetical protein Hrd1104_02855 [Halorhabdus sp. CBA1104]
MDIDSELDPATVEGLPAQRPLVAIGLAAVVATVVYLAIQLAMDGTVELVETAAFTIVFTGVYVAFLYLRRQLQTSES